MVTRDPPGTTHKGYTPPLRSSAPHSNLDMVSTTLLALAEAVKQAARQPRVKKQAIELTDAAAGRIKQLLDARHKVCGLWKGGKSCGLGQQARGPLLLQQRTLPFSIVAFRLRCLQEFLRLGVKKRGCSGLSYTLNYAGKRWCVSPCQQVLPDEVLCPCAMSYGQGGAASTVQLPSVWPPRTGLAHQQYPAQQHSCMGHTLLMPQQLCALHAWAEEGEDVQSELSGLSPMHASLMFDRPADFFSNHRRCQGQV